MRLDYRVSWGRRHCCLSVGSGPRRVFSKESSLLGNAFQPSGAIRVVGWIL